MTIEEARNFYIHDNKLYELNTNQDFLNYLDTITKLGYNDLELGELQELINYIVNWYEIKYPDKELAYYNGIKDSSFLGIKSISKVMNIKQLLYRLTPKQVGLIEGKYYANGSYQIKEHDNIYKTITVIILNKLKQDNNYLDNLPLLLKINSKTGKVLEMGELEEYLSTKKLNLEQLYLILKNRFNNIYDLSNLEKCLNNHGSRKELRDKILEFTSLKLLYSRNTIPEYGYIRAKRFIEEFNKKLNLTLSVEEIDKLINSNYKIKVKVKNKGEL